MRNANLRVNRQPAAGLVTASRSQAAHAEPLRIGVSDLGRARAVVRREGEGPLRQGRGRGRADQHGDSRGHVRRAVRRADRHDRCHSRRHAAELRPGAALCLRVHADQVARRRRHRRQQRHPVDRRSRGQDGGVRRAHGVAVLSERAAQGRGSQRGGHRARGDERRRCRQRLSDAGGRRRRQLGAVAHAGQGGRARASSRRHLRDDRAWWPTAW